MLADGEVDVANVSSVEYARHAERYVLLPSLCVGSDGAVDSVQLVTELPLARRARPWPRRARAPRAWCLSRTLLPAPRSVARAPTPTRAC